MDMGIIKEGLGVRAVNRILILIQPAHLQKLEGKSLSPQERDIKRADIVRSKLSI